MSVLTKIALRYLVSKKAHNAVNIISIISTLGVVVTTAALICVLSVFNGFRGLIMGKLAQLDPQIAITATQGKAIEQADSVLQVVKQMPGVAGAIPVIEDHALAVFANGGAVDSGEEVRVGTKVDVYVFPKGKVPKVLMNGSDLTLTEKDGQYTGEFSMPDTDV